MSDKKIDSGGQIDSLASIIHCVEERKRKGKEKKKVPSSMTKTPDTLS